ncbi:MAG: cell division protein FtsZ [Candidatus Pacebacteria bacterium]|nr:cell division protein FtsZ [Candidatus Paceibacterota bacterium]
MTPSTPPKDKFNLPKITVVGVGGSGNNATNYMIKKGVKNVKFIAVNTDLQDLNQSRATKKIKIGQNITNGVGAGMNPEIGRKAALEAVDEITTALKDTQMLFITGGMGGGTGTGGSPVIASIAKDLGILTVAVVTKPFSFEGGKRDELAKEGIDNLAKEVDAYIVIENNKILETTGEDASLEEAFALSDEVLRQAVEGISELITRPGIINIDYADIKAVLEDSKLSLIGIGSAKGSDRAQKAAIAAINSPLIDISTKGSGSILFSISSSGDLKMSEITEIAQYITEEASPQALIKFGTARNSKLRKGEIKVTVVASNFDNQSGDFSEAKTFGLNMQQQQGDDNDFEEIDDVRYEEDVVCQNDKKKSNSLFDIFKSLF